MSTLKSTDSCRSIDQPGREKAAYEGQMRWGSALIKSSIETTLKYVCVDEEKVRASYKRYA